MSTPLKVASGRFLSGQVSIVQDNDFVIGVSGFCVLGYNVNAVYDVIRVSQQVVKDKIGKCRTRIFRLHCSVASRERGHTRVSCERSANAVRQSGRDAYAERAARQLNQARDRENRGSQVKWC